MTTSTNSTTTNNPISSSVFLRTCRKEATPFTPIWLMRQAGRYQPEYRAIRQKLSFIELCKHSDAAAEVTVLPVTQLGVDAAILFADILLILEPLGIGFAFGADDGPKIAQPIRSSADVDRVAEKIDAPSSLGYVMQTIRNVKRSLPNGVPLIGFAGAPFTLASYVIEGGGSKNYLAAKSLMHGDPGAFAALMTKLTSATIAYLEAQIHAGVDAVQLFDSWVGCLSVGDYDRFVAPHMERIFKTLSGKAPTIHFGTGNPALHASMKRAGGDVIGIDWRADLGATWNELGDCAIQGNLDPALLVAPRTALFAAAESILTSAKKTGKNGHIFNLGHGIFPQVQVDDVRALVDFVHAQSAR